LHEKAEMVDEPERGAICTGFPAASRRAGI